MINKIINPVPQMTRMYLIRTILYRIRPAVNPVITAAIQGRGRRTEQRVSVFHTSMVGNITLKPLPHTTLNTIYHNE